MESISFIFLQACLSVKARLSRGIVPGMVADRRIDRARGARIKYVRTEVLGMGSQEKFAKEIAEATGESLSRGAVGNWELGQPIGIKFLTAIAKLAGIPLDWLAYNAGEKPVKRTDRPDAPRSAEDQLRSALLSFGVDRANLGRAVSAVRLFVNPDEQSEQDLPGDQFEPASRRREEEPLR